MLLGLVLLLRQGVRFLIVVTVPRGSAIRALSKDLVESTSHLFAVIEVMHGVADELPHLVALAHDDDGITWLRPRHNFIDRLGARISFTDISVWVGLAGALDNRGTDSGRVFGTGIVISDHG